ncbi:MAG: rhomboid family intramembrane serine protease [Crocinitomicaceae bacterium]|nr:rhomboid family intramembrane serine protease [Crocinitomicaceae bacterium]
MNNLSAFDYLKNLYRTGGMTVRLIFVNSLFFIFINIFQVYARLMGEESLFFNKLLVNVFALKTDFFAFIYSPWGILTNIFSHFSFWHFAFNMVFLYFSGKMFEQLFDQKRLLYTYLLGGIVGGVLEIIAHYVFPSLRENFPVVVGASGAIMAIFVALAFHRPNLEVRLFGILPIKLIFLAVFFLIQDFLSLGTQDGTAHFAHLGGALLGALSIRNIYASKNIINIFQRYMDRFFAFFSNLFKSKPRFKSSNNRFKSDEQYNYESKKRQNEVDQILDKISKSGYDSLSKKEKDFLFKQSKK